MITIPTGELTGVLADAIPFAWGDDELPDINCLRVQVRPRGPMELAFAGSLTLVTIGERFTGAIAPATVVRDGD